MRKTDRYKVTYEGQDNLSPAARRAQKSTSELHKATKGLSGSFGQLGAAVRTALPFLTGAAVIGGMTKMIKMTADAGDKFAKMSQKLGLSVETLSTFDHVAKLSGITIDVVGVGLRRFAQNALDMSRGIGEAKREFEELGIPVTDMTGKVREMEDLLLDIADRFSEMEDGTTKTAMAMRLFGRSGSEMIPMLNKGKAGIRDMMEEAQRLGLVFSEDSAKAMERFNDNLTRLKGQLKGFTYFIGEKVIPVLSDLLEQMGFGVKAPETEIYKKAIKEVTDEIERLEGVISGETAWSKINRAFMSSGAIEEAKERLSDLRAELRMYRQHLDYITEAEKRNAEAKRMAAEAEKQRADSVAKTREAGEKEAAHLTFLGEKFTTTYQSIGEAMLKGSSIGKTALEELSEEERAWIARLEYIGEKFTTTYDSIGEAMLNAGNIGNAVNESIQESTVSLGDIMEDVWGRIETALASSTAAMIFGQNAWKSAAQGIVASLIQMLAQMGIKKVKEMWAGSAENTAKALESAAEYDFVGAVMHGLAAGAFMTAGTKWGAVKHRGGMVMPFDRTIGGLRSNEVPIVAQIGEGVLSKKGVETIGGPAAVEAANRGVSIGTQSIIMTNNMGPINNMADISRMGELLAEKFLSTVREYI